MPRAPDEIATKNRKVRTVERGGGAAAAEAGQTRDANERKEGWMHYE